MTSRTPKNIRSLLFAAIAAVCTLLGYCPITASAETAVRIDGSNPTYYPSLQAAIDNSRQGDVIQARATSFNEHLVYNRASEIRLHGGYGSGFNARTGVSVVRGDLKVSAGKLTVKHLSIAPDMTPPALVSVSPREGMSGVPVNCIISVTFNEPIRAASISPGTIAVKDSGNNTVTGTVSASGSTVFFTPSANLKTSTTYAVTVAPGIRDLAGNATTTGYSWQFGTTFEPGAFDFSITPTAAQFNVWREELNGMVIDLKVTSSIPFPVMLTIEGCPPAAVCMASPNNVFNYVASVQQYVSLLVTASEATPLGSFPLTIRGDGGGVYRSATITVNVGQFRGITRPTEVWGAGGTPVATAFGHQLGAVATGDGAGGAIFLWEDSRETVGIPDIYGQRISQSGTPLWQTDGIPLITAIRDIWNDPAYQQSIAAIPDGAGGALFTWEDDRHLQGDIFGQRVNSAGVTPWQKDGVPVCTACWLAGPPCANQKSDPQTAPDSAGGAIITWHESRDGFHGSVWAQRITASGAPAWQLDGVPVAYGEFNADFARIIGDGAGGAIIVWQDGRNGMYRYRAQRLSASGAPLWVVNGVDVPGPNMAHRGLRGFTTIGDGAGGVIVTWVGTSGDNTSDLYAQRLDPAGNALWGQGAVAVCSRPSFQYGPTVATDGSGGAIIAWEDLGASAPGSGQQWIYAQRLDSQGKPLWQADGIPLYTFHGSGPQAASDDAGGAIIVWDGFRLAGPKQLNPAIHAQHVTGDGQILWTPNGFEVFSLAGNYGMGPQIISDGLGGAIIHWTDYRLTSGENWDIFGQRLTDKVP